MKKWKTLFFSLLCLNIILVLVAVVAIFQPIEKRQAPSKEEVNGIELGVVGDKKNLNALIDKYLKQEFASDTLAYNVVLNDEVEVYGKIVAFGRDVDIKMTFAPIVQKNGNLVLEQTGLSVGALPLPVETVLKYVNNHFPMPEWVSINPKKESIYVALNQMELENGFRVKAEKFDLKNDEISIKLIDPSVQP
ncbi:YpmS family protein [Priestia endophytica]|uniref:YpmS family protein n=1 Tax=Priestia endophytica TaxID=135735 RepID=UPI002280480E|nr:YpmS family protein [Priestia endophytica]MCY8231014.1 YpmS family protein [Priestia endophytica]